MKFTMPSLNLFPRYERDEVGDMWSFVENQSDWGSLGANNILVAQNHPILTPGLQFVSKIFSQAQFHLYDLKREEKTFDSPELDLLNDPNYYQTQEDFLETLMFTQVANGYAVVWMRKIIGYNVPETMYLLNPNLIEYPNGFRTKLSLKNRTNPIRNQKIIYDRNGENLKIPIGELKYFYDLPNGLDTRNMFKSKSRLDGLQQTLINTKDSLKAKNIILKSNGRELITGKSGSIQLSTTEKKEAERLFNTQYGLGVGRSRSLITKADINHKSLHIPVRDLGLDESVKVDGNIIFTALHIPKDILSLEAKKTTYNNFKESMVSYLQNEMQSSLDAFCAVLNKGRKNKRFVLRGSYEHLPIMQYILKERYEGQKTRAEALQLYRNAGMPDEVALELLGFDRTIKLKDITPVETTPTEGTEEEDKKLKRVG